MFAQMIKVTSVDDLIDIQGCAGKPDGESAEQESLKQAAEDLRSATNMAASSCVVRKQTLSNLQVDDKSVFASIIDVVHPHMLIWFSCVMYPVYSCTR